MVEMFIRLCPLCKIRAKGQVPRGNVPAAASTEDEAARVVKR